MGFRLAASNTIHSGNDAIWDERSSRAPKKHRGAEVTQADEVMITTMVYDHAARKQSYALIAKAFDLPAA
jgi:hypothetical protein